MRRRQALQYGIQAGLLSLAGAWAISSWAKDSRAVTLPVPESLADAIATALRAQQPLVVMVSLEGCPFCKVARESYLHPLMLEKHQPVVQIDMRSSRSVVDAQGTRTTHDSLVRAWGVKIAPTLLFVGEGGRELAPRLVGGSLPDFYGAYLDQRIETAQKVIRGIR